MAPHIPQPELFITDEAHPDQLSINPDALAPQALAKRAFDMASKVAEHDRLRAAVEAEEQRASEIRSEREDDNPHYGPIELSSSNEPIATPPPRRPTVKQASKNARLHEQQAYRKRWPGYYGA